MKYAIAPALVALALASASAETRNLSGFDSVNVADRIRVEVVMGASHSVNVTGADANRVRTRVGDDTLYITEANRPWFGGNRRVNALVRVTMPAVEGLSAARGAEVRATGIRSSAMSLAASMGGELSIDGECRTLSASASMGGAIRADDFHCADADISASMGGEARVYASNRFDVAASMGGAVNVAGEGQRGDVATSMGGALREN